VLAVVGSGIWLGVQHLNYLEFGELRRVAQRTIDQRQIVINNLSVRRAVEELKVARGFDQVRGVLVAAFESNDFDGFELQLMSLPDGQSLPGKTNHHLHWSKLPHMVSISSQPSWKLTLDLVTTSKRRLGSLIVYRSYSHRDLQLDVNLLTSEFPATLANALDRVLVMPEVLVPAASAENRLLAANL
jgi:hypothetical protein